MEKNGGPQVALHHASIPAQQLHVCRLIQTQARPELSFLLLHGLRTEYHAHRITRCEIEQQKNDGRYHQGDGEHQHETTYGVREHGVKPYLGGKPTVPEIPVGRVLTTNDPLAYRP